MHQIALKKSFMRCVAFSHTQPLLPIFTKVISLAGIMWEGSPCEFHQSF